VAKHWPGLPGEYHNSQTIGILNVNPVEIPEPDMTEPVSASISHPPASIIGTGDAAYFLSPMNPQLTRPVIISEGMDILNQLYAEDYYAILCEFGLLQKLLQNGYDLVFVNYKNMNDFIQNNAFVLVELIQKINNMKIGSHKNVVIGLSLGGVIGRYALTYMEANSIPHDTRLFISLDSPHQGENIPLGLQHCIECLATAGELSSEIPSDPTLIELHEALRNPGSRQISYYHVMENPSGLGNINVKKNNWHYSPHDDKTLFFNNLKSLGNYPKETKNIAIANGSGRILRPFGYEEDYITFSIEDTKKRAHLNIRSISDNSLAEVFDLKFKTKALIIWIDVYVRRHTVDNTLPYDNSPGGTFPLKEMMGAVSMPDENIVIVENKEPTFIPTVSALDVNTNHPHFNILEDPNIMSRTPFDKIYYPAGNQNHMQITQENTDWILNEILSLKGDVNSDGVINIVDALRVAQYYVGIPVAAFNPDAGDADCNQKINIIDALLIAQYYVGIINEFPC
jgi:hypothetical protein